MIDTLRHQDHFNPENFEYPVHIVGCGATGSKIALSLAKLGIKPELLYFYDNDVVEEHNIANQAFIDADIGTPKIDALQRAIEAAVEGSDYNAGEWNQFYEKPVDANTNLFGIVFLLTDTMASRKEIVDGLKNKLTVDLIIETRMGADSLRIYTFEPKNQEHIRCWEAQWYPDEDAETSACGALPSVGPTSDIISGMAVWQMIRWFNQQPVENEIIMSVAPTTIVVNNF